MKYLPLVVAAALVLCALPGASVAGGPPSPGALFVLSAEVYDSRADVLPIDGGCSAVEPACVGDGTVDYSGTSGATASASSQGATTTLVLRGPAAAAWQGIGQVSCLVGGAYLANGGHVQGASHVSQKFAAGFSLRVTYTAIGGETETHTRSYHPTVGSWRWRFRVPRYSGLLASVRFELVVLARQELGIERTDDDCGQAWGWATTDASMTLWRRQ